MHRGDLLLMRGGVRVPVHYDKLCSWCVETRDLYVECRCPDLKQRLRAVLSTIAGGRLHDLMVQRGHIDWSTRYELQKQRTKDMEVTECADGATVLYSGAPPAFVHEIMALNGCHVPSVGTPNRTTRTTAV